MRLLRVDQISMSWIDSSLPLQLSRGLIQPGGTPGIAKQTLHHAKVAINLSSAFLKGMSGSFRRAPLIALIIL